MFNKIQHNHSSPQRHWHLARGTSTELSLILHFLLILLLLNLTELNNQKSRAVLITIILFCDVMQNPSSVFS